MKAASTRPQSQTLEHYGEDRLIATLSRGFSQDKEVLVGIGDDCAVLGRRSDPLWTLYKTDALIEEIHFGSKTEPARIGWKAMARAVSDVAAMGGIPRHALVTIAAPAHTKLARLKGIYDGLRKCCKAFKVSLVGGETSKSPGPLFLNISLLGTVESGRCILRSGAKPKDKIYVTGTLGGSIRGKHLDFVPRLKEARWLTQHFRPSAMMDLSDGVGADLPRLAKASGLGFRLGLLPCTKGCSQEAALSDGEDYELLFAISPAQSAKLELLWAKQFPKLPLTCIGEFTKSKASAKLQGHDHFA